VHSAAQADLCNYREALREHLALIDLPIDALFFCLCRSLRRQ